MKQQSPHVEKLELGSVLSSSFSLKSWVDEICKGERQLYKLLLLLLGDECILDTIQHTSLKFEHSTQKQTKIREKGSFGRAFFANFLLLCQ
jgi:hypothetical protein